LGKISSKNGVTSRRPLKKKREKQGRGPLKKRECRWVSWGSGRGIDDYPKQTAKGGRGCVLNSPETKAADEGKSLSRFRTDQAAKNKNTRGHGTEKKRTPKKTGKKRGRRRRCR